MDGGLACIECGERHGLSVSRCTCGGALDPVETPEPVAPEDLVPEGDALGGFAHLVDAPVGDGVTLGEGGTRLLADDEFGARLKLEHTEPTGSFKDRGAAAVVSAARELGAERVVEDSSGNAGSAVAAYAARAGLDCTVFSPEHVTDAKRARMEALGAEVQVVEGPRSAVTEAAVEAAEDDDTYYASHTYPPHFLAGCETFAYEIVHRLGSAPSALVTPCAMGSVVLGSYRGFWRLREGGAVEEIPPIVAVQAAGWDPIARAFDRGGHGENTLADGLLVGEPPREHQIVEALQQTDGTAVAVDEEETRRATRRLHRRGVLVEPSSATALAGLTRLRETGEIALDEEPVLVLTGRWSP